VARQTWENLLFVHWPVRESELAPLVPAPLQLERWEGRPWISVSPFRMTGMRLRGLPPVPYVGRFLELNVRTYVTYGGVPGIIFISLDASNRLAVEVARLLRLPYVKARMSLEREKNGVRYRSVRTDRRQGPAEFAGTCRVASDDGFEAQPGTDLHWLTERYRMYTVSPGGKPLAVDIHHGPWQLRRAEVLIERNTMAESRGIRLEDTPPLATFTERMDVLVWPMRPV
jgi:uncharacterized protein YqjF (DUF2071 family)